MVHFIGFAALMALMVFVMYNDIMLVDLIKKNTKYKKRFLRKQDAFFFDHPVSVIFYEYFAYS